MRDKYTNRPRGFGFLTLDDEEAAARICQETHVLDGRQVSSGCQIPCGGAYPDWISGFKRLAMQCVADRCKAIAAAESEAQTAEALCRRAGS
jgi:hypothetical protein